MTRKARDRTVIDASRPAQPNVVVSFMQPIVVHRLFGIRRTASTIMLRLREPQQFAEEFGCSVVEPVIRPLSATEHR